MVFTRPLISKNSSPSTSHLGTVPRAPITIGITVTFMFHFFFQFPSKVWNLILLFAFFQIYSVVSWDSKVHSLASSLLLLLLFLFLLNVRFVLLAGISWSVCMSKSQGSLCVSFSRKDVHIPFASIVKSKFLAQFPVDHIAHPIVSRFILFLC